ncbi:MAG TPA: glycosyltransferase [Bryobacteraceae bacterium]|nr:glycosyltransferase [Bryobacteraceae bacterium]
MSLSGADECVCLVIPCYNEAARLNIHAFRAFLATNPGMRLLFVDDGSRDATYAVLEQLCQGYEHRTEILSRKQNRGKAEAVRGGIIHALDTYGARSVGFWDADLATPLDTVANFVRILTEHPGIEMVFGSRVKLLGRHVERRAARHYLGRVFATAVSVMLRLPIYDTQCGAKLFRVTPELREVFSQPFISKWIFDVEILARYLQLYDGDTKRLEQAIYEYPLETWVDVAGSKVRGTDFFTALVDIARIKLRYLR